MIEFFNAIARFLLNVPPFAIVFPYEGGVFFRGGKYRKTIGAGFYLKWPFYDSIYKISIKEQVINLPNQSVTTRDGKIIAFSGAIKYEVGDAKKAILNVVDYDTSLQNLALGTLASYASRVDSKDCTYDNITKEVLEELQTECENWGLEVADFLLTDMAQHRVYRIMSQDTPLIESD